MEADSGFAVKCRMFPPASREIRNVMFWAGWVFQVWCRMVIQLFQHLIYGRLVVWGLGGMT